MRWDPDRRPDPTELRHSREYLCNMRAKQPLDRSSADIYLGAMSGTSMDGLDLVATSFDAAGRPTLHHTGFTPYPEQLKTDLMELATDPRATVDRMCELDTLLGEFYAASTRAFMHDHGLSAASVRALGNHGQTIRHRPSGSKPYTLQIGNPAIIAARCAITVISDFRRKDIALGGQGAPLAPAFHQQVFHDPAHDRVILNIGGIANLTFLPADPEVDAIGFDTGPGNTLIDALCRRHSGQHFDQDGAIARSGHVDHALIDSAIAAEPFFQLPPPKSTGTDHFNQVWLAQHGLDRLSAADAIATASELTCRGVALGIASLATRTPDVFVCGGGAHNSFILERLSRYLQNCHVRTTDAAGIDPDWVEATAFAWLAWRNLSGLSGNLPSVTNAKNYTTLGSIQR